MNVGGEIRKLSNDCLALELREIGLRLDVLETESCMGLLGTGECKAARHGGIDQLFDEAERRASERHSQTLKALELLADAWGLRERLARIEAREKER